MSVEKINSRDSTSATITRGAGSLESVDMQGVFTVSCKDGEGKVKWSDEFPNAVLTAGKNALLNTVFAQGSSINSNRTTWYMGLIVSNGYSAISSSDTHASHSGWLESGAQGASAPGYSQTTRRALTWSNASGGSKSTANAVVFSINVAGTFKGAFIANSAVKASTNASPVIYSAGLFSVGDKAVSIGDTLNVTYTASA
jgi:hypothetical protein